LAVDELAEEIHRRLIQLYAFGGDRGAALRQFERCSDALERELGLSPLPETRAVYEAALRGELKIENEELRSKRDAVPNEQFSILNSSSTNSADWSRARAGDHLRAAATRRCAAADLKRAGRGRQDAAWHRRSRPARGRAPRWGHVCRAGGGTRSGAGPRGDRPGAGAGRVG